MAKRAGSSIPQFRVAIDRDVLPALRGKKVLFYLSETAGPPFVAVAKIGKEVQFSYKTKDEYVAKARELDALRHLNRLIALTRSEPVQLSHRELNAYAGDVYRLYVKVHYENPGETIHIRYHKALHRAVLEGRIANPPPALFNTEDAADAADIIGPGDLTAAVDALPADQHDGLEDRFGLLADWVLITHEINLAPELRRKFLRLIGEASLDAGWQIRRFSENNYSDDPKATRFPPIKVKAAAPSRQTITGLFESWWEESRTRNLSKKTYNVYKGAISRLVQFVGHDDANRLTDDDLIAFKTHRITIDKVTPKTFRDGDLPGIKTVFSWAKENRKIPRDPTKDVKIRREKKIRVRPEWFTDEEATAIFRACLSYKRRPKEYATTAAAKKWAPLIAAYTGCRIGEAIQLRTVDIIEDSGHYVFRFTPEAGGIKTGIYRFAPIHHHLIELGFLKFVEESKAGPLFAMGSYERIVEFVREIVPDKGVQPNHAWRHRFRHVGALLGLDTRTVEAICGWVPRTAGERYAGGEVPVIAMVRVMEAIPTIAT